MEAASATRNASEAISSSPSSSLFVRPLLDRKDISLAAQICHEAFNEFNSTIGLPDEFPSLDLVQHIFEYGIANPNAHVFGLFERRDGGIDDDNDDDVGDNGLPLEATLVGSNMVDISDGVVAGVGPITVSSRVQNKGGGRLLMEAVMTEAAKQRPSVQSVRLMQICSNTKSFSLYLDCGFVPVGTYLEYAGDNIMDGQSPCSCDNSDEKFVFETLIGADKDTFKACSDLHRRVAGTDRINEIRSTSQNPSIVKTVVRASGTGEVVAYMTGTYIDGHTVSETLEAFQALMSKQYQNITSARRDHSRLGWNEREEQSMHPLPSVYVSRKDVNVARWLSRNGFRLKRMVRLFSPAPLLLDVIFS